MPSEAHIHSIKEVNRYIRMKLDGDGLLQHIWLRGEISNFTHHASNHMYFTLKDADSRLRAIMFASHHQKLAFRPKEGMRVITHGYVTVYERDGQYQFYAQHMQPDGIGSLHLAYQQLKERLQQEGLFAQERKRPLPRFPQAIGIVTSATGAAVRDIIITLQRRQPGVNILLYPVLVQGTQAAACIAAAIATMNRLQEVDVLIVGRGGGSMEELWAFNEELVARSIADSVIPIISAVGHETDFTIADFVADLRAPTPTAAAELAVVHHEELNSHLSHVQQRLLRGMKRQLESKHARLARVQQTSLLRRPEQITSQQIERLQRLLTQIQYRFRVHMAKVDEQWKALHSRLREQTPVHQIRTLCQQLTNTDRQLRSTMTAQLRQLRTELGGQMRQLDALSPLKIMSRGYSLVYDEDESKVIRTLADVELGDMVKVKVSDGQLNCQVWSMKGEFD